MCKIVKTTSSISCTTIKLLREKLKKGMEAEQEEQIREMSDLDCITNYYSVAFI